METHFITSKIAITTTETITATVDKEADFGQIFLRARKGKKFVNFRVTNFGQTVTAEFFNNNLMQYEVSLQNHPLHTRAFQTMMDKYLA